MPSCPVVLVFLLAALLNLTLLSGGSSEPPSESLGLLQVCQRDADSAQAPLRPLRRIASESTTGILEYSVVLNVNAQGAMLLKDPDLSAFDEALDAMESGEMSGFLRRHATKGLRLACAAGLGGIFFLAMGSSPIRWVLALGIPAVYAASQFLFDACRKSPLHRQIDTQWRQYHSQNENISKIVSFLARTFEQALACSSSSDVRSITEADAAINVSVILRLDNDGKIGFVNLVDPLIPLFAFEMMLRSAPQRFFPVELVARLINGRVVYMLATYQPLSRAQERVMMKLIHELNGLSSLHRLRSFKCANFIQRTLRQHSAA